MHRILYALIILVSMYTPFRALAQCGFTGNFLNPIYSCSTGKSTVTFRLCNGSFPSGQRQLVGVVNGFPITYYGTTGGPLGPCPTTVTWTNVSPGNYTLKIGTTTCSNYTVTVTEPSSTGSISITPSRSPSLCQGEEITLTASGGSSYSWTGDGNTRYGASITVSPSSTTTYTVTGSVSTYCGSTSDNASIPVNVTPRVGNVSFSSGLLDRCQGGGTTQFTASATNVDSDIPNPYTWTLSSNEAISPGSISSSGFVTWNSNFFGPATVTVTAHGCNNSTSTAARDVDVHFIPTAYDISAEEAICVGSSTIVTLTGSQSTVLYQLYKDDVEMGSRVDGTGSPIQWSGMTQGTYKIVAFQSYCPSVEMAERKTIASKSPGQLTIIPSQSPNVCEGDVMTLTPSGGSGYSWSPAGDSQDSDGTITISPSATTTYTLSGFENICNTAKTATIPVNVTPRVGNVSFSSGLMDRCQGGGTTQYVASATDIDSDMPNPYTWTLSSNEAISPGTISSSGVVTWNSDFFGTATVSVTAHGCNNSTSTAPRDVDVHFFPTAYHISAATDAICAGSTTTVTLTGSDSTVSYQLYKDDLEIGSPLDGTESPLHWLGMSQGTYKVVAFQSYCPSVEMADRKTIATKSPTGLTIIPSQNPKLCQGDAMKLTPSGGSGYSWSPVVDSLDDDGIATIIPSTTTMYVLSGFESTCGTPKTTQLLVTVYEEHPVVTAQDDLICSGEPAGIDISSDYSGSTYTWTVAYDNVSGPASPGAGTSITDVLSTITSDSGTATYSITATSPNGCDGDPTEVVAYVKPKPINPALTIGPFCDFEVLTLSAAASEDVVDFKWYDSQGAFLRQGRTPVDVMPSGSHVFQFESISEFACISETKSSVTVQVVSSCDDKLNSLESTTYNYNPVNPSAPEIVTQSTSYFDGTGQLLQTQVKHQETSQVWISQTIKDELDRGVISTLPAPSGQTDFQYKYWFVTDQSGALYEEQTFDLPVGATEPGTLGWYYSVNNDMEDHVPISQYPYTRVDFYKDGTGELRRSAGPGEVHRLGQGHEVITGTFPVFAELNDYLLKRTVAIPGITQDGSLTNEAVQSVVCDENGKYTISISDKSGKTVMTCRQGKADDKALTVTNTVTSSGDSSSENYRPMTYFYILHDQPVNIAGSTDFVAENILTDERKEPGETFVDGSGNWPAGFYRILLNNSESQITINYVNYFLDVAYQFYDDAGRLKVSLSPNGYMQLKGNGGAMFALDSAGNPVTDSVIVDLTSYQYNHQGWLLSMTEPDAGKTEYVYRKDGKIRFSQNAEQRVNKRFSYTHYDKIGRPVESGEYEGTRLSFVPMTSSDFVGSDMNALLEKSYQEIMDEQEDQLEVNQVWVDSDIKDWVRTHYDLRASPIPNLPADLAQDFVRGAVSWTENVNIKTWYSYDEFGRVTWMAQKPAALDRTFITKYTYDFMGNVLQVMNGSYYSGALTMPFYHHYEYDADKRLSKVYTSTDGVTQKLRATYQYYLHGPLKRIELGDRIQGIDFVYNINGWLTQINHPDGGMSDPGKDGQEGIHSEVKPDVFGMVLDYYESAVQGVLHTSAVLDAKSPNRFHRVPERDGETAISVNTHQTLPFFKSEFLKNLEMLRKASSGEGQKS